MKILITLLIIGYCCVGSDAILLALKAKLLGYKVGKAAGIATGLKKGALIGGVAGYGLGKQSGGEGGKVIKYYTNPIYSYDPRPLPSYGGYGGHGGGYVGHGGGYGGHGGGYGGHAGGYGGHGSHGPIIKVLHKHVPQSVNVYHHSHQNYGNGGIGGGIDGGPVQIVKVLHDDSSYDGGHHNHHHDYHHHQPSEEVSIVKVIEGGNNNIGHSGHGWA